MEDKNEIKNNKSDSEEEAKGHFNQVNKWLLLSVGLGVLVLALGISTFFVLKSYYDRGNERETMADKGDERSMDMNYDGFKRRSIDGVLVDPGEANLFPVAVVLDNHPDAYPQAGLSKANLVFEAEVEGGISRYMAIFASKEEIDEIGPVRSARPYFLDWAQEFSACFTHCGGSPEALVRISKDNIMNMNEFYQGEYFWRNENRTAPHNVMTSSKNLREYVSGKDKTEGKFFSWQYKDAQAQESEGEYDDELVVSNFGVKWVYDPVENEYARYLHGDAHLDIDDTQVKAKNILVAYVEAEVIDELLRLEMETIGTSTALICFDGNCREGEWHKKSPSARMRFYNINGEEFILNAGTTWVEVVRPEYEVKY